MLKNIQTGINFLEKEQHQDGSFPSITSANPDNFAEGRICRTVFSTTLILQSLNCLPENDKVKKIKQKAAGFLLSQKSKHWTFNYWAREAPEFKTMPYPDDLDDTACALAALHSYDPRLIDGETLGRFVMTLNVLEKQEGGPYKTWLVHPDADEIWKDIDLAVNSNIAYFLSLQDVLLPNLTDLVEQSVDAEKYYSPYYRSFYSVIYFISRFYSGHKKEKIIDFLFAKQNNKQYWDKPLNTALAVSALLNFGIDVKKLQPAIDYLSEKQSKGSWQPYPFYTGINPKGDKKKYYAGSAALTAAFCLEAIAKYAAASQKQTKPQMQKTAIAPISNDQKLIHNAIIKNIQKRINSLGGELKKRSQKIIDEIIGSDKDNQILLLPYFIKMALGKNGKNISNKMLIKLGLFNIYGWTAYTIYDDFFDNEGDSELLPTAIWLIRELSIIAGNLLPVESDFHSFFQRAMDKMDNANVWEVANCRIKITNGELFIPKSLPDYGDYSKLAERSMGHIISPIAILFSLGFVETSPQIKNLTLFFKNYIIARQLNDDVHDWEEDLKNGCLNGATVLILKKYLKETSLKTQKINLTKSVPDFQRIFWYDVAVDVAHKILRRLKLAEQSLSEISIISNPEILTKFLKPIRQSAEKVLTERQETIKFLKVYQ